MNRNGAVESLKIKLKVQAQNSTVLWTLNVHECAHVVSTIFSGAVGLGRKKKMTRTVL